MTQPTTEAGGLARRFAVDIDTNAPGSAVWASFPAISELKFKNDQRRQKDDTYDDAGAERNAVVGSSWSIEAKISHRSPDGGITYNTVQEYVRAKALSRDTITGEIHLRIYDRFGGPEAYDGRALVMWVPEGGAQDAIDNVTVTFDGQGALATITNPNASNLPVVYGLTPTGGTTAGGTIVRIRGRKLTGATAVTFGGTAASSFVVDSDSLIIAIAPAKAAGSADVLVTTPAGVSANTAADNYLYA